MKRLNNLYEKIISLENLRVADAIARKGKLKSYGVKLHDKTRDQNIHKLHKQLIDGTYKTSKYHIFNMITDAGKERTIYRLPYFPDRILHHAIMNIMEPIWVSIFTTDTYSCIKKRGIHGVFRKLKNDLKNINETTYCLKIDVRKFYPSINHKILKTILRKKIKDKKLLSLLDEIIESTPGVPIGNYLSQFFANIYLAYFDHWIKEVTQEKYYYRYADDIVVLCNSKQSLHKLLAEIQYYFSNNLKIDVKSNYQIFPVDKRGIDFVGYVFRHTHILMRKRIKQNFARKFNKQYPKRSPLFGWAIHCNSKNLIKTLSNEKSTISRSTNQARSYR